MRSQSNRIIQIISFMLILSVGTLFASVPRPSDNKLAGVLQTSSSVVINGNSAEDGTTILSGAQITTRDQNASIRIPQIGSVQLDPNTTAILDFSNSAVNVKVLKGNASLNSIDGVQGTVVNSDGEVVNDSSAPSSAKKRRVSKGAAWGIFAAIAAATTIIIIVVAKKDDASPVRP